MPFKICAYMWDVAWKGLSKTYMDVCHKMPFTKTFYVCVCKCMYIDMCHKIAHAPM